MTAEFEANLRRAGELAEVAAACRLVVRAAQPLLDTWRRQYPKVPPNLDHHNKAQSEFVAITGLIDVLERVAAEAPESGPQAVVDQMLAQAEEDLNRVQQEQQQADLE